MVRTIPVLATSRRTALGLTAFEPDGEVMGAVVVVHGFVAPTAALRDAVAGRTDPYVALAAKGLGVLALDLPGHGHSGGRRGRLTYRGAVEAVAEAATAARSRWQVGVGALGLGIGGTLATYAALEGGGIDAVVAQGLADLRDVHGALGRRRTSLAATAAALAARVPGERLSSVSIPARALVSRRDLADDPVTARCLARHPQSVRRYDADAILSLLARPDDKPDLAALSTPLLVATGERDRQVPPAAARAAASRVSGPVELWLLPGAGAQLWVEHPRAIVDEAHAFFARHLPAA